MLARLAVGIVGGYLAGTFPSAALAARLFADDVDLRKSGSCNPGAANARDVLGRGAGAAVVTADIAKAIGAATVGRRLVGSRGANMAATAAVLGHCYPVWTSFRGGKGVAASVGQVTSTFPIFLPADAIIAGATAKYWPKTGQLVRPSFASVIISSTVWVAAALIWWRRGWPTGRGQAGSDLPIAALVSSAAIMQRFIADSKNGPDQ